MSTKQDLVLDTIFTYLMDHAEYEGTLQRFAEELEAARGQVAQARSRTRSAEFMSEHKWYVSYVGVGNQAGRWFICDLTSVENCERSKALRWPEVAEDCRRLAAIATLHREALERQGADREAISHAKAEERTAHAMASLAEGWSD